jgi:single-stranded-DNA-specific exonuclease
VIEKKRNNIYMHQLVSEYVQRFQTSPPIRFNEFFTQLKTTEFRSKLPFLYDIEIFCKRVGEAILNEQQICIYSDYDTDAITATATMYWGLLELGVKKNNLNFYAPDRFTEGYGMNPEAAIELSQKYDLVISVDCGINSVEEAKVFAKSNCDLIITDHHQLNGEIPDCIAVVNPRLTELYQKTPALQKKVIRSKKTSKKTTEDTLFEPKIFVSSSVTGVGVSWFCLVWLAYFLEETNILHNNSSRTKLNSLLPFVAIGTIADCQSVLDPINRMLVRTGLSILQQKQYPFAGLAALMQLTGLQNKIDQGYKLSSQDLGYILSPILNSSGRISHANLSISVLLESDKITAETLSQELIDTNTERKKMVKDILFSLEKEVKDQVEANNSIIWLEGSWNKGIIGLLASRFVNQYDMPVIITTEEDGKIVGSSRAPEGYNLPLSFEAGKGLFEKAGGHPGAAGFSFQAKNAIKIKEKVSEALSIQKQQFTRILHAKKTTTTQDTLPEFLQKIVQKKHVVRISENDLNQEFLTEWMMLDPFGQDFPFPHFLFQLSSPKLKWLGIEQKHIKFSVGGEEISLTGFNLSQKDKNQIQGYISKENELWVLAKISQNTWNGSTKLELIIETFLHPL